MKKKELQKEIARLRKEVSDLTDQLDIIVFSDDEDLKRIVIAGRRWARKIEEAIFGI